MLSQTRGPDPIWNKVKDTHTTRPHTDTQPVASPVVDWLVNGLLWNDTWRRLLITENDVVKFGRNVRTFRWSVQTPSSGSYKLANRNQTTRRRFPEGCKLVFIFTTSRTLNLA
jgi:hypothetical protein